MHIWINTEPGRPDQKCKVRKQMSSPTSVNIWLIHQVFKKMCVLTCDIFLFQWASCRNPINPSGSQVSFQSFPSETLITMQCCLVYMDQSLYAKMKKYFFYSEISDLHLWRAQCSTVRRHDSTSVSVWMSFSLLPFVCRICYTDSIGVQEDQYPPNIAVKVNQSYCHVPVSCFPPLRQATPSKLG